LAVVATLRPFFAPVRLVHASEGKAARAAPVSPFEAKRAKLAGRFPALEDEMAGLTYSGGYEGPGRSPDRRTRWSGR
jgi:phage terminase large subunit-like protein